MKLDEDDGFWSCASLAEWLERNVPPGSVISPNHGITVEMLIKRLNDIADEEWSAGIDAMGEDA